MQKTFSAAQGHTHGKPARGERLGYFKTTRSEDLCFTPFTDAWLAAGQQSLNAGEAATILSRTAKLLHPMKSQRPRYLDFIAHNLRPVEKPLRRQQLGERDLMMVYSAYASLHIWPGGALLEKMEDEAAAEVAQARRENQCFFKPQAIASIVYSYGMLAMTPEPRFFAGLKDELQRSMPAFGPQELANTMWGLSVHHLLAGERDSKQIAARAKDLYERQFLHHPENRDNVANQRQYLSTCQYFGWRRGVEAPRQSERPSTSEALLRAAFDRVGFTTFDDGFVNSLGTRPDLTAKVNDRTCYIQVDGHSHFIQTQDGRKFYDGSTLLQSALTRRESPDAALIRLGEEHSAAMERDPKYARRMKDLVSQACSIPPAAFETAWRGDQIALEHHLPRIA